MIHLKCMFDVYGGDVIATKDDPIGMGGIFVVLQHQGRPAGILVEAYHAYDSNHGEESSVLFIRERNFHKYQIIRKAGSDAKKESSGR